MTKAKTPFPSMEDLVAYLNDNPGKVGKRAMTVQN